MGSTSTTTSVYFQNYSLSGEQKLQDDLISEAIRIHGMDIIYVKRNLNNYDQIYNTDDQSSYTQTWMIAAVPKNVFGFTGDREFMAKFAGPLVQDQIVFSLGQRMFNQEIGAALSSSRPREGDLIYIPINQRVYVIRYVNQYEFFFPFGKLPTWDVTCELFDYSGERFDTGIEGLDRIQLKSLNVLDYVITDTDGAPLLFDDGSNWVTDSYTPETIDPMEDNDAISNESDSYLDWSENSPFGDNTANSHVI